MTGLVCALGSLLPIKQYNREATLDRIKRKNQPYWTDTILQFRLQQCSDQILQIADSGEEIDLLQAESAAEVFHLGFPPLLRLPRLQCQTLVTQIATSFMVQLKERIPGNCLSGS